MSSPFRLKTNVGKVSDLSAHEALNNDDTMSEILLLLPPETIYKLILVSKRWLEIISCPLFRYNYLKKWRPSFQLIGFFVSNTMYLGKPKDEVRRPRSEPSLPLLSTSYIGEELESSGTLKKLGYYIDSSNGVLLCGRHPYDYCLWDPSTKKQQHFPCPSVHFEQLCMSLIAEDCPGKGFSYKVIRAECLGNVQSTKVKIQTYSSETTTWSYSELTCQEPISLTPWTPGRVINGVIYWYDRGRKVAIYDSKSDDKQISLMKLPQTYDLDEQVLGDTADGCLQYGWSNKAKMEIWKLEKINNVLEWNILFKVKFRAMWGVNPIAAKRFSTQGKRTHLLAFFKQKSDLVYIRCETQIFICDILTQRVEKVQYLGKKSTFYFDFCKVVPYFCRCWPSSRLWKQWLDDQHSLNNQLFRCK